MALTLSLLLLAACAQSAPAPAKPAPAPTPAPVPAPVASSSGGAEIYDSQCGTCHDLPTEKIKSYAGDEEMLSTARQMATMANLSTEDTQKLLEYLRSLRIQK